MKLIKELMKVTPQEIEDVRKMYNKTAEDVKIDVKILKDWMSKQPHLPQNYDDERLERMLLRNKFRIEQSKSKIDGYFTLRGMYPQFYQNREFTLEGMDQIRKSVMYVPTPELTESKERVVITKFMTDNEKLYDIRQHFEYILAVMDLEFSHDYAASTRFVVDLEDLTMTHVKALELNMTLKGFILYQTAYSARISAFEYINVPKYFDLVLQILKLCLKPKMFEKIRIHKDLSSLQKIVNKKYLPSNYGGDQKSVEELHEMMGNMWKEEIDFIASNAKLVSNEKLRIGEPYTTEGFGLDGTFKKIDID